MGILDFIKKLFNKTLGKLKKTNKLEEVLKKIKLWFCITKADVKQLILSLVVILCSDLITKYLAFSMKFDEYYICSFLSFLKVKNYGISFGLFQENADIMIYIIIIFDVLIVMFLLHSLKTKFSYRCPVIYSTANFLIISGAVGNLFDRIYYGFVRDFIDFHIGDYHWPCFNMADVFICIGVGIFILCDLFFKKK